MRALQCMDHNLLAEKEARQKNVKIQQYHKLNLGES